MGQIIYVDFRKRMIGQYDAAIARLDRAATQHPDCAPALMRLKRAYEARR